MTLLVLQSCKSASSCATVVQSGSELCSVVRSVDTIYQHDSIFIREYLRGDTVYLTRTEWRDRWRIHEVHDTIMRTDSIVQVVEHPPERYVPKFYKISTLAFYLLLLVVCFIIFRKFW